MPRPPRHPETFRDESRATLLRIVSVLEKSPSEEHARERDKLMRTFRRFQTIATPNDADKRVCGFLSEALRVWLGSEPSPTRASTVGARIRSAITALIETPANEGGNATGTDGA